MMLSAPCFIGGAVVISPAVLLVLLWWPESCWLLCSFARSCGKIWKMCIFMYFIFYLFIYLFIHLFIYSYIYLFIYLFIRLFIY